MGEPARPRVIVPGPEGRIVDLHANVAAQALCDHTWRRTHSIAALDSAVRGAWRGRRIRKSSSNAGSVVKIIIL